VSEALEVEEEMTASEFVRDSFHFSFEQGLEDVVRQEILDYAAYKFPTLEKRISHVKYTFPSFFSSGRIIFPLMS